MDAQEALDFMQSEQFRHQMAALYLMSLAAVAAIFIAVLVLYLRVKSSRASGLDGIAMLLAAAFDTFLISLLYIAIEFSYSADQFRQDAHDISTTIFVIGGLLTMYGRFAIHLLLLVIALIRAERLARWFWQRAAS